MGVTSSNDSGRGDSGRGDSGSGDSGAHVPGSLRGTADAGHMGAVSAAVRRATGRPRAMSGRDPGEPHRASTPLELLFDLCFVVAVSQAAVGLHHDLAVGHFLHGIGGYLTVFFAIWWAWMNFTWFASAYDTDDVPYRLLTLLQITGVLVLASGVDVAFDGNFELITVGYVIMRVAMIAQWLRAAASDPAHRILAIRYAQGIFVTQLGWIGRLFLPESWGYPTFFALVAVEMLTPLWAERADAQATMTPWHPEHIAERYGLFTIIVLGECILSSFGAINAAITGAGVSARLVVIAVAALVTMFGLWWSYFRLAAAEMLVERPHLSFSWGYLHYGLFASIAAFGAGIAVVAEWSAAHEPAPGGDHGDAVHFALSDMATAATIGIPVAATMLIQAGLHAMERHATRRSMMIAFSWAALVVVVALLGGVIGVPASLLLIAAIVTTKVTFGIVTDPDRRASAVETAGTATAPATA